MFRLRQGARDEQPAHALGASRSRPSPGVGVARVGLPGVWGLLTSFKTERDVLAYPPVWLFKPTLANYREVIFGASSIVPNLWSSFVVADARRRC